MPLPMMGSKPGMLLSLTPFSIHGQMSFNVVFQLDGEPQQHQATVAREAVYAEAQAGDAADLTFMMGNVVAIQRRKTA
jgi:hypothetical protein